MIPIIYLPSFIIESVPVYFVFSFSYHGQPCFISGKASPLCMHTFHFSSPIQGYQKMIPTIFKSLFLPSISPFLYPNEAHYYVHDFKELADKQQTRNFSSPLTLSLQLLPYFSVFDHSNNPQKYFFFYFLPSVFQLTLSWPLVSGLHNTKPNHQISVLVLVNY